VKLSKSGVDMPLLPTDAKAGGAGSAFSKWQHPSSSGLHLVNPCVAPADAKHKRVPSWGSEYSKLLRI